MTRRRILYRDADGTFWMTDEFNGDKDELENYCSLDSCSLNWPDILNIFVGIFSLDNFKEANRRAQLCYHSCFPNCEPSPIQKGEDISRISCDLYICLPAGVPKLLYMDKWRWRYFQIRNWPVGKESYSLILNLDYPTETKIYEHTQYIDLSYSEVFCIAHEFEHLWHDYIAIHNTFPPGTVNQWERLDTI